MGSPRRILPFHIVDVFAVEPLTGNPLAVVEGGEDLTFDLLQRIAREFNQSETTFLMPPTRAGADWRLRSITAAGVEVFGAGHNALGAWWWLAAAGKLPLAADTTLFHQEIGDQVLPVTIASTGAAPSHVIMRQEAPEPRKRVEDLRALALSLGLTVAELAVDRLPCQVVFTGAAHLLVPVRDRDAVDRIRPDARALFEVLAAAGGEGCYVFSLDPRQPGATAYARFFNPTVGIWEDPATGTAAGPLAAHLVAHGLVASGQPILIEQGTAMGRTSLIRAEVVSNSVNISGRGVVVASGRLTL
jgi:trans-2,3-dihydro-3-hydroxyanthranilate isomerase